MAVTSRRCVTKKHDPLSTAAPPVCHLWELQSSVWRETNPVILSSGTLGCLLPSRICHKKTFGYDIRSVTGGDLLCALRCGSDGGWCKRPAKSLLQTGSAGCMWKRHTSLFIAPHLFTLTRRVLVVETFRRLISLKKKKSKNLHWKNQEGWMKGGRIFSAEVKPMKVTTWLQDRLHLRHQRLITRLRPYW